MNLLTLQRDFCVALRAAGPAHLPAIDGDAATRFGVYHSAYRSRLKDTLRETFEKTWEWLGDDRFGGAIEAYVEKHPPQSWTLADYGDVFPAFLDWLYPDDREVGELAWLEWTMHLAFIGPDATALAAEDCECVDWDRAILRFVPTLQLRPAATNAGAIWAAVAAGETPPEPALLPAPAAFCVWRRDLRPSFRTIDEREYHALKIALSGASFGEFCQLMSLGRDESETETVAELGRIIARWLAEEMLAEILSPTDEISEGAQ